MFIVFVFRNTFSDIISSIDDIMATQNDIHEILSDVVSASRAITNMLFIFLLKKM